jgi:hypothetical protein
VQKGVEDLLRTHYIDIDIIDDRIIYILIDLIAHCPRAQQVVPQGRLLLREVVVSETHFSKHTYTD